jgi:hypothetical protein
MQRKIDDEMRLASAAPTEAPTMTRAAGSRKVWRSRGAAIGVIALALSLAACGGSSSNDDPPVGGDPTPVDPAPVDPTPVDPDPVDPDPVDPDPVDPTPVDPKPVGFTKLDDVLSAELAEDVGDRYTSDTDPTRVIVYDPIGQKYYEFVKPAAPVTWDAARVEAAAKGGDLAVLDTPADMLFVNYAYDDLGGPFGDDGTWVGASQAAGATQPGEGWTWIDGTVLAADSELWNDEFGGLPLDSGLPEAGKAQYGTIYNGLTPSDTKLLFDHGAAGTGTNPKYLIEYANKEAIK